MYSRALHRDWVQKRAELGIGTEKQRVIRAWTKLWGSGDCSTSTARDGLEKRAEEFVGGTRTRDHHIVRF
jgi:hypothetical protein